jgi:hypothetical protein
MFKGVFQCIPSVGILYFDPFNPFHYFPLPLYCPPFFNSFQYKSLYPLFSQMLCFMTVLIVLMLYHCLFLSLFPRVLQGSSTITNMFYIWICIWSCSFLCICLDLWVYLPCMRENMQPLSFWAWLISLNMMSSNCIHLLSNHIIIPYGWEKLPLCVYTTFC